MSVSTEPVTDDTTKSRMLSRQCVGDILLQINIDINNNNI